MKKLKRNLAKTFVIMQIRLIALFSKRKAAEKALAIFSTPLHRAKRETTALFQSAEKMEFDFNGDKIRGFRWNHPAARKALILHGHESSVLNFEMYVKGLLDKGYEVLAFDAPAHGISEGKTLNAVDYRDFVIYIHENFGPVQSYLGHSFGGLAISLAMEKIKHDETYRLAFIAPATEAVTVFEQYFNFLRIKDKKVKEHFENLITEIGNQPSTWYSVKRALQNIKAKVLWAHDEVDPVTPFSDALKAKEQNYPNVQFMVTKGLGHNKIYRDPEVVKAVVEFL